MLHVRHELQDNSVPSSAKQQREITKFAVMKTTSVYNRKSLIPFNLAARKVSFGVLCQHFRMRTRWHNRKIVTTRQMFVFKLRFPCSCRHHC